MTFISSNKALLDISFIHSFLTQSHWARGIPRELVEKSIQHSICVGAYSHEGGPQIGFARAVTDQSTFAYLADVFIDEAHRGQGISKRMVKHLMDQPELQGLRKIALTSSYARGVYAQLGFQPLEYPHRWMEIHYPNLYRDS